ncbi:hypothetical protein [Sulfurovum sp. NBC37-1]|uniref:hypothetical protein n=1 Tax=Sulfurovum sp. (strain NBC37-1) TaxID=387093 RepID=UPI00015878D7|nr:hypothetical protein [Sulfurovum sp. NBC37-1]BAF71096.1 hypothetical protein SUN_0136 [Sulfurovum sp. NBC37-1]
MKVIIDLIEDIRESIANAEDYVITAGLLKEDPEDSEKLIYAGEAPLNLYDLDPVRKQLIFKMDGSDAQINVGALIPPLLISDMDTMMYELRMDVNAKNNNMEIVGFGKNEETKKYLLFIKI